MLNKNIKQSFLNSGNLNRSFSYIFSSFLVPVWGFIQTAVHQHHEFVALVYLLA